MATNNFKSFGIGAGANVTSQADYEALAALLTGFQSGKASSAQINKALRQSSTMAYVLAQFISDIGAVDVLDNGAPATILANLKSAIQAISKNTAIPLLTGVVGQTRNLSMIVTTAASTATITADEIIVETALGGSQYRLGNFTKSINLTATGAGGMDTGTVPASGFVGIYAIYNPTTGTSALLAVNASTQVSEVYSGSNMPSGYTASALLTVVPTSGSQFKLVIVTGRKVSIPAVTLISTSSILSASQVSIAGAAPLNAISIDGGVIVSSTAAGSMVINVLPSTLSVGVKSFTGYAPANTGVSSTYNNMLIAVRGSIYVTTSHSTSGTPTFTVSCVGYEV